MVRIKPFMAVCGLTLILGGTAIARPAEPAIHLSLNFTVKSSGGLSGTFPAMLTWNKGVVTGTITYETYSCVVNAGSTDIHSKLNMTCTVSGLDTVTIKGTLNVLTGKGKGTVSDTLFNETGTYKVAKAP